MTGSYRSKNEQQISEFSAGLRRILFQNNKPILKLQAKLNKIIVRDLLDACEIYSMKLSTFIDLLSWVFIC